MATKEEEVKPILQQWAFHRGIPIQVPVKQNG